MPEIIGLEVANSEWTFNTLRAYMLGTLSRIDSESRAETAAIRQLIASNHTTYLIMIADAAAMDARAIESTREATAAAFEATEKAIEEAIARTREETTMAFNASEKAISKAESASEKRFESVNEFRKTLTDQTATFMPRPQIEALITNLNEKVDEQHNSLSTCIARTEVDQLFKGISQQLSTLQQRVDRAEGMLVGNDRVVNNDKTDHGLLIKFVGVVIGGIALVTTILLALRAH